MSLDVELFRLINSFAGEAMWADRLIIFFAKYLPYLVVLGLLAFAWLAFKTWRERLAAFLVPVGAGLLARFGLAGLIHVIYVHPRPFVALTGVNQLIPESGSSFPSGHTIFFFALATALFLYNRALAIWFLILGLIIGVARVAAGVHYPYDILGGIGLGVCVGIVVFYLARRLGWGKKSLAGLEL